MTIPPTPPPVWPVPVNETAAEPALLVIVSVALFGPAVVGRNVTETVVDVPGSSVVVPGAPTWNCDGSVPAMLNGVVSVSGDVLLFEMLTGATLALPTVVAGNASVPGSAVSAGPPPKIGRASCRERVESAGGAGAVA